MALEDKSAAVGERSSALRRIVKLVRRLWRALGMAVVCLIVLEGILFLGFFIGDHSGLIAPPPPAYRRAAADTYAGAAWVGDYYDEFHRSFGTRWAPYVYWRRKEFHGKYINVDADGIRLTPDPVPKPGSGRRSLKIFMFGGSTMWGTGARDGFTIPAILARELRDREQPAKVMNFGESGYVTTQDVIALLLQLQKGNLPDLVIFYDGANDIFSALQQNVAGLPQNEFHRVNEFNLSMPTMYGKRIRTAIEDVVKRLPTYRLLSALWPTRPFTLANSGSQSLAGDIVARYWHNVEVIGALGEHYHFKPLFYWQPVSFDKKYLTEFEAAERRKQRDLEILYGLTHDALSSGRPAATKDYAFEDLSAIFAETREPLYVDWAHLGESGNEPIARKMTDDVLAVLGAGTNTKPAAD